MTFAQIVRELVGLSEKDAFETNVDEGQLTKLLQHHAQQGTKIKIGGRNGKVVRPWVVTQGLEHDTGAIRKAVEECGL